MDFLTFLQAWVVDQWYWTINKQSYANCPGPHEAHGFENMSE